MPWSDQTTVVGLSHTPRVNLKGPSRLVFLSGPNAGRKVPVSSTITLGTSHEAVVHIPDPALAPLHMEVVPRENGTANLRNLQHRAGTKVNGEPIEERTLVYGDHVQLGDTSILFTHYNPLELQLAHKSKMEVLGRLSAGVAHDLNNLLTVVSAAHGVLDRLPTRCLGDEEVIVARNEVPKALERATELNGQLLAFARQGQHAFGKVNFSRVVREVMELVRRTTPRSVGIHGEITDDLLVAGDRTELTRMILNLCVNATDAMPGGGTLTVSVLRKSMDTDDASSVWLSVTDSGIGMDRATMKRAFDPLFSTKSGEEGAGLGLALVAETAKYHGGQVSLTSTPGEGTSVEVEIPLVGDQGLASVRRPSTPVSVESDHTERRNEDFSAFVSTFDQPDASVRPTPRLIFLSGPQVGKEVKLEWEVTIGRSRSVAVPVKDREMSRAHARFMHSGEGMVVEDLRSKNGTFVNDIRITKVRLQYGDKIRIGSSLLLFTHSNPLDRQLAQKSRMEMLGRLGAGVAHDFNNLLGVMMATEEYMDSLPATCLVSDPQVVEARLDGQDALRRAAELTSRLRGFAHLGDPSLENVDVSTLAKAVMDSVRRTCAQPLRFREHLDPGVTVLGNQGQLHQLLLNLCVNAVDAMPEGGTLTVRVSSKADAPCGAECGEYVVIQVSDTGLGMDAQTQAQAVDPFFTTKPKGEGTGLGLATVVETAKLHGGSVAIDSAPGNGTHVWVCLPTTNKSRGREARSVPPAHEHAAPAERAVVMLVDDNDAVRRSVARLIRSMGYSVTVAADGQEALERYATEKPDVVILDLDMPRLAGRPASRLLLQQDPTAKVLWMSGHAPEGAEDHDPSPIAFLPKPCNPEDLRRAIELALRLPEDIDP